MLPGQPPVYSRRRVAACIPLRHRGLRCEGRFLVVVRDELVSAEGSNPRSPVDDGEATTGHAGVQRFYREGSQGGFEELGFAQHGKAGESGVSGGKIGGADHVCWHPLRGPSRAPAASPAERACGPPGLPPPGEHRALVGPSGATGSSPPGSKGKSERSRSNAEASNAKAWIRREAEAVQLRGASSDGVPSVRAAVRGVLHGWAGGGRGDGRGTSRRTGPSTLLKRTRTAGDPLGPRTERGGAGGDPPGWARRSSSRSSTRAPTSAGGHLPPSPAPFPGPCDTFHIGIGS